MKKNDHACFLVVLVGLLAYSTYLYGLKKGEEKPPIVKTEVKYIDDKCLCIKCGQRFNFSEVNYLIEKLDEEK